MPDARKMLQEARAGSLAGPGLPGSLDEAWKQAESISPLAGSLAGHALGLDLVVALHRCTHAGVQVIELYLRGGFSPVFVAPQLKRKKKPL